MNDTGNGSYPGIHPMIQREIDRARGECSERHERTDRLVRQTLKQGDGHHERLIELTGRSGRNGRVGVIEEAIAKQGVKQQADHEELEEKQLADHDDLTRIKLGQLKYAGFGGFSGGGAIFGVIELMKWLT